MLMVLLCSVLLSLILVWWRVANDCVSLLVWNVLSLIVVVVGVMEGGEE